MFFIKSVRLPLSALAVAVAFASTPLSASEGHGDSGEIGEPGDLAKVSRTVEVVMHDNYYEPEEIVVKEGETVRFRITNAGSLVHEFNIGTAAMHAAHQDEMMMMVEHGVLEADRINEEAAKQMQADMGHAMKHDDPNSVLLEPGESAEVVWTFPQHAELQFACNVPGHYEAGMQGEIELTH
jgi:uncharacterized cupredoxin-like copper-binding protein